MRKNKKSNSTGERKERKVSDPLKRKLRKEIKKELTDHVIQEELDEEGFRLKVSILEQLTKFITRLHNQTRASIENRILKNHPKIDEIKRLRADRNADKKGVAKIIKTALKDEGYTTEEITELKDKYLEYDPVFHSADLSKKLVVKQLEPFLMRFPIYVNWLSKLRGIDVLTSAKLIRYIRDIRRFRTTSKLWKYSGLAVIDGKIQKKVAGEFCGYSPKLQSFLLLIADNLVMVNSPLRKYYDSYKERDARKHPDFKPFYLDARAKRYLAKMFEVELFTAWYRSLGLEPPTKPYILAKQPQLHHEEPLIIEYPAQL